MYKKLIAKTQYLNPALPESIGSFSKGFSIEPENDDALLKHGTIYAIFDVTAGSYYDTHLTQKVVYDILHASYFQSENISPIQSLEKAISDVKDKVTHLANESIRPDIAPAEFNIIAGVLWGNVMYMVQYGTAQCYLVRQGEIKPINTISEGTYAAASGVVKDGDVIIFCSKEFGRKYPPDKLLTMAIGEQDLTPQEACILLKFIVDTNFSPNEVVDFGLPEVTKRKRSVKNARLLQNVLRVFSELIQKLPKRLPKRTASVASIKPVKLRSGKRFDWGFFAKPAVLAVIIVLALAISIGLTVRNRANKQPDTVPQEPAVEVPQPLVEGTSDTQEQPDEQVFYDIKISDVGANPTGIASFNNVVVTTDSASGKMFISDQTTAKFEAQTSTFVGIKNLINIGGKLGFTDNEGYKVYNLADGTAAESYKSSELGVTSAYLNYVYSINGDKLTRYSKNDATLEGSLWGQNENFSGAKSFSIAYSIYLITNDGKLESYTSGQKDSFAVSGEAAVLSNPTQVLADIDFKYIYVADNGNGRVVAFDDKGNFVKEYKPKKDGAWNDIRGISVTPNEKTLFLLNGSKVYKLSL